uniref:Uncharacterized protein n=1 Tax=Acrobeloides nanus TaxID=290746 RepID=A0A914C9X0_9BILA
MSSNFREDKTYISSQANYQGQEKPILDQASEALSNAAEATKDTLSSAAESVQEGLISAKEAVFGKAEDARESVDIAAEKVNAKADKVKEKDYEVKGDRSRSERFADKAENFTDKAAKGIQRFGEKAADTIEEIGRGDKVREKERQKDFEKNIIRHNEDRFTRAQREQDKGLIEKCGEKLEEFGQRIQGEAH